MRLPRVRFTIRSLMIAVLVFACPLALPTGWLLILIGLAAPCLALFGLPWLVLGANRRRTMFDFCVSATFINVLFAAYCIAPDLNLHIPLMLGCLVILGQAIGLLGAACATLSTQEGTVWRRFLRWACLPVIALSIMPLVTVLSCWPLRLAFFFSRPTLECLADQVAGGQSHKFPRQAGLFRVAGSAVDIATGNVGLLIDPDPYGRIGFVRLGPGTIPARRGHPIGEGVLDVQLGGGWWYLGEGRED
jgi:hypothetical protein